MRPFHAFAMTCLLGLSLAAAPAAAQTGAGGQSGTTQGQSGTTQGQSGTTQGQSGTAGQSDNPWASDQAANSQDDIQKFVEKAAISNMAEIQLGQLAQQRAQDPEVKQFAQMMVDEHTRAQSQLQQAAGSSNLTLPTSLDSKHQKIQDKLSNLSGAEFDREYMKAMVKAHKDTAKLLEKRVNASGSSGASGAVAGGTSGTSGSGSGSASGTSGTSGTSGSTSGTSGSTSGSMTGTEGQSTSATSGGSGAAMSIDSWAAQMLPNVQQHLQHAKDLEDRVKGNKDNRNDK